MKLKIYWDHWNRDNIIPQVAAHKRHLRSHNSLQLQTQVQSVICTGSQFSLVGSLSLQGCSLQSITVEQLNFVCLRFMPQRRQTLHLRVGGWVGWSDTSRTFEYFIDQNVSLLQRPLSCFLSLSLLLAICDFWTGAFYLQCSQKLLINTRRTLLRQHVARCTLHVAPCPKRSCKISKQFSFAAAAVVVVFGEPKFRCVKLQKLLLVCDLNEFRSALLIRRVGQAAPPRRICSLCSHSHFISSSNSSSSNNG